MITIYDLLEIDENASKDEIDTAYSKMLYTYRQDPSFSDEKNKENEMIMNKIKIAYEILSDDTKRKRYNSDLSKKRAENLLKGINKKEEKPETEESDDDEKADSGKNQKEKTSAKVVKNQDGVQPKKTTNKRKEYDFDDGDEHTYDNELNNNYEDEVELTKEEQAKLKRAAQEEFQKNLIKAKKAEEEYKKAYEEAYNQYMKKNSYASNGSMTLRKFGTIFITIIVSILVFFVLFHIPPVKAAMNTLYEENEIIRVIVDIFRSIIGKK